MGATPVSIRPMEARDLDRVCEIEEEIFPSPWSRTSFEEELASDRCAFPWVAEKGGGGAAHKVSGLGGGELHLGNIAVAPPLQGSGIGRALFAHCLARAVERGVSRATLEVRVSNARAISLYESHGFIPVAIRKSYYSDTGEDAVVMLKTIPGPEDVDATDA
jgi:ribosomal-protein-alanine N-acetyltransferase